MVAAARSSSSRSARGPSSRSRKSPVQIWAFCAIGLPYRPRSSGAVLNRTWATRSSPSAWASSSSCRWMRPQRCVRRKRVAQGDAAAGPATGLVGMRLVHPARLGHPQSERALAPRKHVQKRYLHGQRQLVAQPKKRARSPKYQASRKRQQVQLAGQIGPPHTGWQARKGPKRQQVLHTPEPLAFREKIARGPRWQGPLVRVGQRAVAGSRQDAEPGAVQVVGQRRRADCQSAAIRALGNLPHDDSP